MGKINIGKIKMSSWCYGLIREGKRLKLVEVYWDKKNKPKWYSYVFIDNETLLHWWWVIKDIPLIIKDIYLQLKYYHIINEDEFR